MFEAIYTAQSNDPSKAIFQPISLYYKQKFIVLKVLNAGINDNVTISNKWPINYFIYFLSSELLYVS